MRSAWRGLAIVGLASMAILVVAACGGGSKSSSSTTTTTESSGTPQIDAANYSDQALSVTADVASMMSATAFARVVACSVL